MMKKQVLIVLIAVILAVRADDHDLIEDVDMGDGDPEQEGASLLQMISINNEAPCVDLNETCPWLAAFRNCTDPLHKEWMETNCRKSCFLCEAPCEDSTPDCYGWVTKGSCYCWKNSAWHNLFCQRSCQVCKGLCEDRHDNCANWAREGECYNNPNWMFTYCRVSCNLCKHNAEAEMRQPPGRQNELN